MNKKNFLFDFDDKKQRGRGCDRLGFEEEGLKLKWGWNSNKLGQCCSAKIGSFSCEVIFWHTYYESIVLFKGIKINGSITRRLKTRISAQKFAEKLLIQFCTYANIIMEKIEE